MKKPHLTRYRFRMPEGCACKTITLRQIDLDDERQAAKAASVTGLSDNAALNQENVRISIDAVDDVPVEHPFLEFSKWDFKSRNTVSVFWLKINAVADEELENLMDAMEVFDPPAIAVEDGPLAGR